MFFVLSCKRFQRALPRSAGSDSAYNAAIPATCGVAMLVPLFKPYRRGIGIVERIFSPGPAMFTSPPFGLMPELEKNEIPNFSPTEATAKIVLALAGLPTGALMKGR